MVIFKSKLLLTAATFLVTISVVLASSASAQPAKNKQIKVIIWGGIPGSGGQPNPGEFVKNHKKAATFPADGMVFNLTHSGGYFVDAGFSTTPKLFSYDQVKKDIELWRSLKLGNLKNNFVRVNIGMVPDCLGNDKEWEIVLKNAALAARGAKECGAEGIMLDSEMYGCYSEGIAPFRYSGHPEMMFEDYKKYVRKRGKQFMSAINSQMPNAKILITFATSSACRSPRNPKSPLTTNIMALMPAFVDGMMDSATPENEIIDCFEYSYYYKTRAEFAQARDLIKNKAAELSADPQRYKKLIKVGFGIFVHGGAGEYSLSKDVSKNSLTPRQFYNVLRYAAEYSDGYIWLYSLPWMNMPPAYFKTVRDFWNQKSLLQKTYTFYAKAMQISNTSPAGLPEAGKKNWLLSGDYIIVSSNPDNGGTLNSTGSAAFRPKTAEPVTDGLYEVLIDVVHSNVKKHNSGSPAGDRNGSFSYRISLNPTSSGKLSFTAGSKADFVRYYPQDPDNCNPGGVGPVALTDFIAYGPDSPAGAKGYVKLIGVKQSDIVFELRDDVRPNYGTIGIKSITFIPVRLSGAGKD